MTNREAQQVISAFLFRIGLEGIEMTDPELKALVMAGEALEDKASTIDDGTIIKCNDAYYVVDEVAIETFWCYDHNEITMTIHCHGLTEDE